MSEPSENEIEDELRRQVAEAFGKTHDPLAEFEDRFEDVDGNLFDNYHKKILQSKGLKESTLREYQAVFDDWQVFMSRQERHPACPNVSHVIQFIEWQLQSEENGGEGNEERTVKGKLRKLNRVYEYWQDIPVFPHPQDYNPFRNARKEVDLSSGNSKEYRKIPVEELRQKVDTVTNIRSRAIIGIQLKLGLRAGEVSNIQISDISLSNTEIRSHYDQMGTADRIADRENAIYIPSGDNRDGNKSRRPRVLPLDDELRRILTRYLLIRPDCGESWLFLSQKSHSKLNESFINKVWKDEFHPEYAETENYRPVTSHFGRHRFTTWWRVEQDVNRELVKYMRGDSTGRKSQNLNEPIDDYIHTYFTDIKDLYLENIYKIGL